VGYLYEATCFLAYFFYFYSAPSLMFLQDGRGEVILLFPHKFCPCGWCVSTLFNSLFNVIEVVTRCSYNVDNSLCITILQEYNTNLTVAPQKITAELLEFTVIKT
jgi:hypothetical protein